MYPDEGDVIQEVAREEFGVYEDGLHVSLLVGVELGLAVDVILAKSDAHLERVVSAAHTLIVLRVKGTCDCTRNHIAFNSGKTV